MARVTGLEPATSGVTGRRSNQLSYTRMKLFSFSNRVGGGRNVLVFGERGTTSPDFFWQQGAAVFFHFSCRLHRWTEG